MNRQVSAHCDNQMNFFHFLKKTDNERAFIKMRKLPVDGEKNLNNELTLK